MTLALFDLDDTLLDGDCDQLWGRYLVARGALDEAVFAAALERFGRAYAEGTLEISDLLEFQLGLISRLPADALPAWRAEFAEDWLLPRISVGAHALVDSHRARGHSLVMITATNDFLAAPVAIHLRMDALLASEAEYEDGRPTGRVAGTPCFREGKVERLQVWMRDQGHNFEDAWFYTDSQNDLPLLQAVGHPHAVNPDPELRAQAERCGWPILQLRAGPEAVPA